MFIKHLGFRTDCHRMDLVGMGCNAGLNGLNPVTSWVKANPGRLAMMICCEVNSALYIYDDTIGTGVVNSLFGDGCAAITVCVQTIKTTVDYTPGGSVILVSHHSRHLAGHELPLERSAREVLVQLGERCALCAGLSCP